jgi:hypothetical protein
MGYRTNLTAEVASSAGLGRERLLQLRILRLGLLQDGDVGVGVFPRIKEVRLLSLALATGSQTPRWNALILLLSERPW